MTTVAVCQLWEESEAGWGTRPDGSSLHRSVADLEAFIKAYWDRMPNSAPAEYSRPAGKCFAIDIDDETVERIKQSKDGLGIWVHDNQHWHR